MSREAGKETGVRGAVHKMANAVSGEPAWNQSESGRRRKWTVAAGSRDQKVPDQDTGRELSREAGKETGVRGAVRKMANAVNGEPAWNQSESGRRRKWTVAAGSRDQKVPEQGKTQLREDNSELFIQKLHKNGLMDKSRYTSRPVYTLHLKPSASTRDTLFKKMEFGKNVGKTNKVIMMVGVTGAGKSTLINSMINHILGVKWTDKVRVKLFEENTNKSDAHSQTSQIHVYKINHIEGFNIPFSLTVIDTPGFGHTGGREEDAKISQQIKECFTSRWGIEHIDAIAFVVKASDIRLTPEQRYVFDCILSIFGQDIKQNIIFCITYSELRGKPNVLQTLSDASIPCALDADGKPIYFKFNNSNMSPADDEDNGGDGEGFPEEKSHWEMRRESLGKLFGFLQSADTKSLTLTREVLKEREALVNALEGLIPKIEEAVLKADVLKRNKIYLEEHKAEIQNNEQFESEQHEIIKVRTITTQDSLNCTECESTCHHPCKISFHIRSFFSGIFSSDSLCKVCDHEKDKHKREKYLWEQHVQTSKKTFLSMSRKYTTSGSVIMTLQDVCRQLEEEIQIAEEEGLVFAKRVSKCLTRLRVIALQQTQQTTDDYIDAMIMNEKCNEKQGYKERIKYLEKIKGKLQDMGTHREA
uniref:AIG1-type G domain-containing protein n=1 Tax=Leptobrachium leishanense TaxID=445787 RepID=A0A8C5MDZ2_9ANUR